MNAESSAGDRPGRFFLSYRHGENDDVHLARFLARELEAAGHEVFIDTRLTIGTDWVTEIAERIAWCDFLVVVLSRGTLHSEMVQTEIRFAHQRRQREGAPRILPIRVGYFGPLDYELDAYLGRIHYARWQTPEDSPRILDEILKSIGDPTRDLAHSGDEPTEPRAATSPGDDGRRPTPNVDPRAFSAPGGTLRLDDPFYIERGADALALQRARLEGETVVVKAPRQLGKSSLLLRYLGACHEAGKKIAFIDFSALTDLEMKDYPTFLSEIADLSARAFGVETPADVPITRQTDLTRFFEDRILPAVDGPIVLAFDEADRLLGRPFQADFFTLLRMWHNLRAGFRSPWQRVDLALVISTEPYLLIDADDRSPFNVTPPIELGGFHREQCKELNQRYGSPLGAAEVARLHELLAGHPYLTRLAFYRLVAADRIGFDELTARADEGDGPFGDHLRALLLKLSRQQDLLDALRRLVTDGAPPDQDAFYRLHGSGLVRREGDRVIPANRLYERFFGRVL